MTAQRGDFERPSPAPSPAARDTWRDQLAERLFVWWAESGGVTVDEVRAVNEGAAEAYADALLPVLVAAQREAAAAEITDRVRVIRALADEATSEAEQMALDDVVARLNARASALYAGGE